jgi:hypothetical protein
MTIAAMIGTVNVVTERLGLQPLCRGCIVPAMAVSALEGLDFLCQSLAV